MFLKVLSSHSEAELVFLKVLSSHSEAELVISGFSGPGTSELSGEPNI